MRYLSFAGPQLCYQRVFDTSDAPPATMHVYLNSWLETSAVLKGKFCTVKVHFGLNFSHFEFTFFSMFTTVG